MVNEGRGSTRPFAFLSLGQQGEGLLLENLRSAAAAGSVPLSTGRDGDRGWLQNLGKSFIEIIRIYYGFGSKVLESVDLEGAENYREAQSKGKGILYLTGHCGNWELLAIVAGMRLSPMGVVARPMNNPYLNSLIEKVSRWRTSSAKFPCYQPIPASQPFPSPSCPRGSSKYH